MPVTYIVRDFLAILAALAFVAYHTYRISIICKSALIMYVFFIVFRIFTT